jgi:hypothetical protein
MKLVVEVLKEIIINQKLVMISYAAYPKNRRRQDV